MEEKPKIHKQAEYTPDGVGNAYAMAECGRCIKISEWDDKIKKFVPTNNCRLTWRGINCKNCLKLKQ